MSTRWDKTLFIAGRHGRTPSNDRNIYRSWSNKPEAQLEHPRGADGVTKSAEWLVAQRAPVELIITDALDRCLESAEIYADVLGVDKIIALRGLHPLNMGDYTGKNKDKYPVQPFLDDTSKVIPGGESVDYFDVRQFTTFKLIMPVVDSYPPGHVLILGHGSTISFLWNRVFKESKKLGYEGLVDPAGLVNVTAEGMVPLTNARDRGADVRKSADEVDYMELPGAVKDADCREVKVKDGVSKDLGCCNAFELKKGQERKFKCGTCEYVTPVRIKNGQGNANEHAEEVDGNRDRRDRLQQPGGLPGDSAGA